MVDKRSPVITRRIWIVIRAVTSVVLAIATESIWKYDWGLTTPVRLLGRWLLPNPELAIVKLFLIWIAGDSIVCFLLVFSLIALFKWRFASKP
jgi:hypothetical protein